MTVTGEKQWKGLQADPYFDWHLQMTSVSLLFVQFCLLTKEPALIFDIIPLLSVSLLTSFLTMISWSCFTGFLGSSKWSANSYGRKLYLHIWSKISTSSFSLHKRLDSWDSRSDPRGFRYTSYWPVFFLLVYHLVTDSNWLLIDSFLCFSLILSGVYECQVPSFNDSKLSLGVKLKVVGKHFFPLSLSPSINVIAFICCSHFVLLNVELASETKKSFDRDMYWFLCLSFSLCLLFVSCPLSLFSCPSSCCC